MGTPLAGKNGSFWSETTGATILANLHLNTGVSNWTNGTAKTTGVYKGAGCALVTGSETMSQASGAIAAKYYVASAMIKVGGGCDPTGASLLKLAFMTGTAGGVLSSGTDTIGTGAHTWTRYSVIRKSDATAGALAVSFIGGTGTTIYVDDVRCTKLEQVGGFSNWSLDLQYDVHDTTSFESAGDWREFTAGLQGWTASATRFWDSPEMYHLLTGGTAIYSVFYIDHNAEGEMTGTRWEGLAHISGIGVTTPVDAVVTSDITFQGTNDIAYIDD